MELSSYHDARPSPQATSATTATGSGAGEYSPLTCVPVLSQKLHDSFSGSHTQFATHAYFTRQDGTLVNCILVMTCTQLFICDVTGYVHRTVLLERVLAAYERMTGDSGAEREVLLCIDGEHDCLLRGLLMHDGEPPKPFLATLQALHRFHHPQVPLILHADYPAPLREIARVKPPPGYTAPLPQREQDFAACPCWRESDVMPISQEEFTERVRNMFIVYHPEKLPQVTEICRKYARRKGGALQSLTEKYGPEPAPEHAAAVEAVLRREARFQEIFPAAAANGDDAQWSSSHPTVQNVFHSSKVKTRAGTFEQPLLMSTLLLLNQPSGGAAKVVIRVTPISNLIPADTFRSFKRRQGGGGEEEIFYLCNEGYLLAYNVSPEVMKRFGYSSGDRVLSTFGVTAGRWSVIVGVRDGVLWAHDEGDEGASALVGFQNRAELERLNGWMLADRTKLNEASTMPIEVQDGYIEVLRVDPETVNEKYGVHHGDVLASLLPCEEPFPCVALVCGVGPSGALYVRMASAPTSAPSGSSNKKGSVAVVGPNDVGSWSTADAAAQTFSTPAVPLTTCRSASALRSRHGLQVVGSAPVIRTVRPSRTLGRDVDDAAAKGAASPAAAQLSLLSRRFI